ncbi:hypothetical protein SDRG_00964 [Saprolegnia diclina VS20]|uniref:Uncharacterized protein n=1 Tax=Saprolegnia diclina (strain VS20) TaxID=1156394 RepID=T0QV91_SAPDV|nr:hypothetical protein SDRG_00964 [Saprolegnia diclina VS20]EQC42124.1 hypothetical protein SDRG_00964 [Saprolegnia diclina VS20]|eukprot:XP_008604693.1 hypothetical protein SDRG_00964 [Saprolegnia diclina VS20]
MIPRIQGGGRADSLRKIDAFVSTLPPRVDMHSELGVDILLNVFSGFEPSGPYVAVGSDREYEALQLAQLHAALSEPSTQKGSWHTKMSRLDAALIDKPARLSNKRDSLHAVYGLHARSRKQSIRARRQGTQRVLLGTMGGSSKMDLKALAAAEVHTRLTELFDLSAGANNAVLDRHKCHVMSICIAKQMGNTVQRKSRFKASMAWTPEAVEDLLFAGDDTIDAQRFCDRFLLATEMVTASSTNRDHIALIDNIYTDVASEIEIAATTECPKPAPTNASTSSRSPRPHEPKRTVLPKGGPIKPIGIGRASPRKATHVIQEILAPTTSMTPRQPASRPVADKMHEERTTSQVLQERLDALQENRRSIFQANSKQAHGRLMSKVKPHPPSLDDDVDLQECKVMTFSFGKLKLGPTS